MFGEHLLVCPKLVVPENDKNIWNVNCTFPKADNWYNWYSKNPFRSHSKQVNLEIPDSEQGIWIRGGAILPILQHTDEMSILHALGNDITLEIYPDKDDSAQGHLYMDDGQTFAHEKRCEKIYNRYHFVGGTLS